MNAADWAIVVVLLVSTVTAAFRGFFHQAFGIAGLVVGYLLAAWQYPRVAAWFAPHLNSPLLGDMLGFGAVFLAVVMVAAIVGRIARWAMKEAGLSLIDRLLGALLGVVKGSMFVAVLLMGMTAFTPSSPWLEDSQLAPYFLVVGRAAIWLAPSGLRAKFYEGLDLVRHAHIPDPSGLMPRNR
ncbi:MAG TPA: CvpA family protein [Terriglobales bacterium]|jgi:membrane protein required for colicin V production|nr:CvpA family protein [Terriglobales bacterium]